MNKWAAEGKQWEKTIAAFIVDYKVDENGQLIAGKIARHAVEKDKVFALPTLEQSSAFKYTGESTFPGGWRA